MLAIDNALDLNVTERDRFGIEADCSNDTYHVQTRDDDATQRFGDGAINGFDLFVLLSAQFMYGAFSGSANLSSVLHQRTVSGRVNTNARCNSNDETGENFTKLEWQLRIATNPCYVWPHDETLYMNALPASSSGRRLAIDLRIEEEKYDKLVPFEPYYNIREYTASDEREKGRQEVQLLDIPRATITQDDARQTLETLDRSALRALRYRQLDAKLIEYATMPEGSWTLIHFARVLPALEITLSWVNAPKYGVPLSMLRAPTYNGTTPAVHPEDYELRFIRHQEYTFDDYNMRSKSDTDESRCANIASSGSVHYALIGDTIRLRQVVETGKYFCAFDLLLWTPAAEIIRQPVALATTTTTSTSCNMFLRAGSSAMGIFGDETLFENKCLVKLGHAPIDDDDDEDDDDDDDDHHHHHHKHKHIHPLNYLVLLGCALIVGFSGVVCVRWSWFVDPVDDFFPVYSYFRLPVWSG
jgi:hypothetical protein